MKKTKPSLIPGIVWLVIVTVLLTMPGSAFPQDNWLSKVWFDKWVHIGFFAVMVSLWCWGLSKRGRGQVKRAFISTAIISLVYGIGMEFVQKYLVANRSFDTGDIIADGIGCVVGFVFSTRRYIKK